jgi:hypothetical protein
VYCVQGFDHTTHELKKPTYVHSIPRRHDICMYPLFSFIIFPEIFKSLSSRRFFVHIQKTSTAFASNGDPNLTTLNLFLKLHGLGLFLMHKSQTKIGPKKLTPAEFYLLIIILLFGRIYFSHIHTMAMHSKFLTKALQCDKD